MRNAQKPSPVARLLALAGVLLVLVSSPALAAPEVGASLDLATLAPEARTAAVARLAASDVRDVRLPLEWGRVEPNPGRFIWAEEDASVQAVRAAGLQVTLVLGPTAAWAVDPAWGLAPEEARLSIPKSLLTWEKYVRAAATHFRGTVRCWQVREQPNMRHFRGATQEYFTLLTSAARVLREVDPRNQVVVPEPVGFDPAGLERRLKPPVGAAWDIWGAYLPGYPSLQAAALPLSVITTEALASPAAHRPVWVVGAEADLPVDRWLQYYLLTAAFGIDRIFAPEPVLADGWARALTPLRYQGWLRLGPQVWALAFQDDTGPLVAAWAETETRLPAVSLAPVREESALRASARVGGEPGSALEASEAASVLLLGPRPVLLRGLDAAGATAGPPTRADVLRARGAPDYSTATSVSVDYSRTDQPERGLYNRALRTFRGGAVCEQPHGDRTAVVTHLCSDPARTADDEPWIYFDVDDSWLYFARGQAPVVVTVEVAPPAEGNEQVGFDISYEAVDGYRRTPWQWVEPGTGWRTYRMELRDVSFTNRDGYDFRINAKGSRQDLWLGSVTLEKLAPPPPGPSPAAGHEARPTGPAPATPGQ